MMPNPMLPGTVHAAAEPADFAGQAWATTLAVTVTVCAIGYMVIERNRPIPEKGPPAAGTMQQGGVPS